MPGCEWFEEPDGFRYLFVDYRDAGPDERDALFRRSLEELRDVPAPRSLVDIAGMEFDPMWFKDVKDASVPFARAGLRMAVLGAGKQEAQRVRALTFVSGVEHTRSFDSRADAVEWLRS